MQVWNIQEDMHPLNEMESPSPSGCRQAQVLHAGGVGRTSQPKVELERKQQAGRQRKRVGHHVVWPWHRAWIPCIFARVAKSQPFPRHVQHLTKKHSRNSSEEVSKAVSWWLWFLSKDMAVSLRLSRHSGVFQAEAKQAQRRHRKWKANGRKEFRRSSSALDLQAWCRLSRKGHFHSS